MNRKRSTQICSLALVLVLMVSIFVGCGNQAASSTESQASTATSSADTNTDTNTSGGDSHKIVMAYIGNEQPNEAAVHAKLNELVNTELGMSLELVRMSFGDYQEKLNLMLSGGDELDILPIAFFLANSYINAGQVVDLSELINTHGKGIIEYMGEDIAKSGSMNGFIYGTPANKESASKAGIVMRKDIVDELGIDVDAIKTLDDLDEIFAKVKAAHPELDAINGTNFVSQIQLMDPLNDNFGVLLDQGQDTTVVNYYETELYSKRIERVSQWYKAGYVKLDAATTTETSSNLVKAGSLFSYLAPIKPGYLVQENVSCGQEMVTAYLDNEFDGTPSNVICTMNVNYFDWGIAQQSKDKEKAMEFLNFAYTSPEFNNLMNFGIEGQDYTLMDGSEVMIDYPEGVDSTSAYHLNMGWMLPNQFIGYVWNGLSETVWQDYQDFNAEATYSKAFGFMPDTSSLATEISALSSVQTEYAKSLETGSVSDWEGKLAEFNEKLYAAGLQKVIDLKQEQLDSWLASK